MQQQMQLLDPPSSRIALDYQDHRPQTIGENSTRYNGDPEMLKLNENRLVMSGVLYKKGDTLRMYNRQYNFYLEKKDDAKDGGGGPYLKYGRLGKPIIKCIDLGENAIGEDATQYLNNAHESGSVRYSRSSSSKNMTGGMGAIIIKAVESRTKFKIITSRQTMNMKANNKEERDQWCRVLVQEIYRNSNIFSGGLLDWSPLEAGGPNDGGVQAINIES